MEKYKIEVQENEDGESFIEFPDEVMEQVGWKEGDNIQWVDNGDGSFTLKKSEELEWVLVDTVSQFRMRYMVQVPKGKAEYALDTVTCEEAKEFSQEHLGETIVSHRVIGEDEALAIYDQDNNYTKSWSRETKIKVGFTSIKDQEAKRNNPEQE